MSAPCTIDLVPFVREDGTYLSLIALRAMIEWPALADKGKVRS